MAKIAALSEREDDLERELKKAGEMMDEIVKNVACAIRECDAAFVIFESGAIEKIAQAAINAMAEVKLMWRPIETATKEWKKREVLLFVKDDIPGIYVGCYVYGCGWFPLYSKEQIYPTHFAPLPVKPSDNLQHAGNDKREPPSEIPRGE